jgi:predicted AAA+ superfamily ATPase
VHRWRDRAGHEADFILEEAGKLVAFEIKASNQVTSSDAIEIRAFRDDLKREASFVRGGCCMAAKHDRWRPT